MNASDMIAVLAMQKTIPWAICMFCRREIKVFAATAGSKLGEAIFINHTSTAGGTEPCPGAGRRA